MPSSVAPEAPPPILKVDFLRFMNAKLSGAKCSFCQSDDFEALALDDQPDILQLAIPVQHRRGSAAPCAALTCLDCGYMNFISWYIVLEWLEKNGEE